MKQTEGKWSTRQLSQEEQDELSERLELLLSKGKQVEATSSAVDISRRPEYFDEEKFDNAQRVMNKYFLSLAMASSMGLMLLLQLKEILIPLLRTGKSRTVADLYDRYAATAKYIKRCYESRFYEPQSEAHRLVNLVRAMHQRIFKIMNSDEQNRTLLPEGEQDNKRYLWVNQFDMALTQFSFMGLFVLWPDKCGASKISTEEMGAIIYFWRLLSYQFGIEERFNLFVYHEDLTKQVHFLSKIFDQYEQRLSKPRIDVGVRMSEGILLAFRDLSTEATPKIVENHWFDVISLTGRTEPAPYQGLGELYKLARYRLIYNLSSTNDSTRKLMVWLYKRKLEKFCAGGDKIRRKLTKKYPNHVFELEREAPKSVDGINS